MTLRRRRRALAARLTVRLRRISTSTFETVEKLTTTRARRDAVRCIVVVYNTSALCALRDARSTRDRRAFDVTSSHAMPRKRPKRTPAKSHWWVSESSASESLRASRAQLVEVR